MDGGWMSESPALLTVSVLVAVVAAVRGTWSPCGLSMVSAVNPFSESARGHRYPVTVAWFVAGAVAGGALLGGAAAAGAWLASAVPDTIAIALIAGCALVTLASDAGLVPLPENPRQVNEHWLGRYRRWVYASGFGFQIGTGFATYIMTAAVYLVPVMGVLSGSPALALILGLVFGLVRGLGVLIGAGATDPGGLRRVHRRLAQLGPRSVQAALVAQASAVLVFAAAVGWPVVAPALVALAAIWGTAGLAARTTARAASTRRAGRARPAGATELVGPAG